MGSVPAWIVEPTRGGRGDAGPDAGRRPVDCDFEHPDLGGLDGGRWPTSDVGW